MHTTTRNATLQDLAAMLQDQHARKIDVVAPAATITSDAGRLHIRGTEPVLDEDGVTLGDGLYLPTSVCDEGIAEKLGIPTAYLRRMREVRLDLYDANVNGWLQGEPTFYGSHGFKRHHDPDPRSFFVRCFRGDEEEGIARAFLSDRYKTIDNLDVLMSALQGITDAGVQVNIDGCDLTDRRMYVRIVAPEVQVMAEELLQNYRNPFSEDFDRWRQVADREGLGYGGEEPVIFAGFVLTNSETGNGAFTIVPRAVIRVCKNGLTMKVDAMREVHLGGKLEEGVVEWSDETQQKAVELIRSKTRDAVQTFLSPDYLTTVVERLEKKASERVSKTEHVEVIVKRAKIKLEHMDGILDRFVQGGQMTRGGVMNAITAHAQTLDDADVAHTLEEQAVEVLS